MRNLFYLIKSIPFIQTAFNYYFDTLVSTKKS